MPKVTVLMPVYNTKEEFLRNAIESILKQTFMDFEFLIINDASTNNVEDVILSYNDSRIVYIKNEKNLGIAGSSNKGIALAHGEYIARQDHDDISLPRRLEEEVKYLDEHPDVGVCSCWFEMFPEKKIVKFPSNNKDIKKMLVLLGDPICHPASMIRKSVLIDHHIFYKDEYRYAEDYGLWVDLIDYTQFYNLPKCLFQYRWGGENTSVVSGDVQKKNAFTVRLHGFKKLLDKPSSLEEDVCIKVYKKEKISTEMLLVLGKLLCRSAEQSTEKWKTDILYSFYYKSLRLTIYDCHLFSVMNNKESLLLPCSLKIFYLFKVWIKSFKRKG